MVVDFMDSAIFNRLIIAYIVYEVFFWLNYGFLTICTSEFNFGVALSYKFEVLDLFDHFKVDSLVNKFLIH